MTNGMPPPPPPAQPGLTANQPAPPQAPPQSIPPATPQPSIVPLTPSGSPVPVINRSQQSQYVANSSLTTSMVPDLINTANPFGSDILSSVNYQRIEANVPNGKELRNSTLMSIRKQKHISESLMTSQKGSQTSESLISQMYFTDESPTTCPVLQCQSVSFTSTQSSGINNEALQHLGVRAIITNRRLVFVDSTKNNHYTLSKTKLSSNSIITPFRKGETYETMATITDDLWFKPLPLPTITGLEIYTSHRSEASQHVANRVAPFWFITVLIAIFGFVLALAGLYEDDTAMLWFGVVFPTLLLVLSMYLFMAKAQVKLYNSVNSVTKSRDIRIGIYDPIHNKPMYISIKIEDSQPLAAVFHWCKELQSHCPRLSGNDDPLILM